MMYFDPTPCSVFIVRGGLAQWFPNTGLEPNFESRIHFYGSPDLLFPTLINPQGLGVCVVKTHGSGVIQKKLSPRLGVITLCKLARTPKGNNIITGQSGDRFTKSLLYS